MSQCAIKENSGAKNEDVSSNVTERELDGEGSNR
jgi:hypothetical protein